MTNSTVSEKEVKSVSILTTGHEKDRFTVMLACLGDGTKLLPYVIFKRKTLPKNANFPKEVIVRCQEKGWMDQGLLQDWLRTVWSKVGGLTRKKSMLVWGSFRAHLSAPIRSTLKIVCPCLFIANTTLLAFQTLLFLFFSKICASKLGVRLIYGCGLYMDVYGKCKLPFKGRV